MDALVGAFPFNWLRRMSCANGGKGWQAVQLSFGIKPNSGVWDGAGACAGRPASVAGSPDTRRRGNRTSRPGRCRSWATMTVCAAAPSACSIRSRPRCRAPDAQRRGFARQRVLLVRHACRSDAFPCGLLSARVDRSGKALDAKGGEREPRPAREDWSGLTIRAAWGAEWGSPPCPASIQKPLARSLLARGGDCRSPRRRVCGSVPLSGSSV
jgi:hypothetical protein